MLGEYHVKRFCSAFPGVHGGSEADASRSLDILLAIIQKQHIISPKIQCMKYPFEESDVRLRYAQGARVELAGEEVSVVQHLGHVPRPPSVLIAGNVARDASVPQRQNNAHHFVVDVDRVQRAQNFCQVLSPVPLD